MEDVMKGGQRRRRRARHNVAVQVEASFVTGTKNAAFVRLETHHAIEMRAGGQEDLEGRIGFGLLDEQHGQRAEADGLKLSSRLLWAATLLQTPAPRWGSGTGLLHHRRRRRRRLWP